MSETPSIVCPSCKVGLPIDAKLDPTCNLCRKDKDRE